jgi:hypothetical protein
MGLIGILLLIGIVLLAHKYYPGFWGHSAYSRPGFDSVECR